MSGRTVSVVLLDRTGGVLGQLPDFDVALPYWQEVVEIVREVRTRWQVDIAVLRLLEADRPEPHGGHVAYLAELLDVGTTVTDLVPVGGPTMRLATDDQPLRMPYARPGGPAQSVAWALERLEPGTTAVQQRTWNLSAIWRLDGPGGGAWLKQVPPFFRHEGAVLGWLAGMVPEAAPQLLAHDPTTRRLLMTAAPGQDLPAADLSVRHRIASLVTQVHTGSMPHVEDLVALGVPDRRGQALATWAGQSLRPYASDAAAVLLDTLPARMTSLDACGFPDVLVHGDLWPGNAVGDDEHLVLLDWGDCFLGHPGFDILRLVERLEPAATEELLDAWAGAWAQAVPGCEPRRALDLLRPLAPLRMAAVYAGFLTGIEPTERPYHAADVPACLDLAAAAAHG